MSYEKDTLLFKSLGAYKVKCKCSHVVILTNVDRVICSHCGNWVYKTPKIKFMYEMKEKIKKANKN